LSRVVSHHILSTTFAHICQLTEGEQSLGRYLRNLMSTNFGEPFSRKWFRTERPLP